MIRGVDDQGVWMIRGMDDQGVWMIRVCGVGVIRVCR